MTPKSDNPKTQNFSMRFDPGLKEALLESVDPGKGGRAGGLSLLFHQLGYLYLDLEVPPQRWQAKEGSDPIAEQLDEIERIIKEAGKEGRALTDKGSYHVSHADERLKALVKLLTKGKPTFNRLRALLLVARYELFRCRY